MWPIAFTKYIKFECGTHIYQESPTIPLVNNQHREIKRPDEFTNVDNFENAQGYTGKFDII